MGLVKISVEPFSRSSSPKDTDVLSEQTESQGDRVLIRSASVSRVYYLGKELLDTISIEGLKNFQWYFERYVTEEPFAYARARVIQRRLRSQGKLILKGLLLPEVCPQPNSSDEFLIEVALARDTDSKDCSFHQVFWEVLGDNSLWYDVFRIKPLAITVVRVCKSDEASEVDRDTEKIRPSVYARTKNVLATTARPSHTKDIPHRLITRSISTAIDKSKSVASLEIVRPGTFAALAKHLAKHTKGHFEIVHLDLHGGTDSQGYVYYHVVCGMTGTSQATEALRRHLNYVHRERSSSLRAYFVFTKVGPLANARPDPVPAQRVASLLVEHGVNVVVMNVCRSATTSNELSNAASSLIRHGIKIAIGMSFNIYSMSADRFMRDFYDYYIGQDVSILQAVSHARRHLRQNKKRRTKYSTEVELEDYVVPILYYQESVLHSLEMQSISTQEHAGEVGMPPSNAFPEFPTELVGREGDMLRIERDLAQFPGMKIHLQGPPGVGKSALVMEAQQWWQKTGFFHRSVFIQLTDAQFQSCTTWTIVTAIAEKLNIGIEGHFEISLISLLNKRSFLLVLDSIDSIQWSSEGLQADHKRQLALCLKRMKTIPVILSSRTTDSWLGSTVQSRLYLEPLQMSPAVAMSTNFLRRLCDLPRLLTTPEDQSFFEQLIQMSRGNPLAIKILMGDLAKHFKEDSTLDMASHVLSLLHMRPIHLDSEVLADNRGSLAVPQLLESAQRFLEIDGQHRLTYGRLVRPFQLHSLKDNGLESLKHFVDMLKLDSPRIAPKPNAADFESAKIGLFVILALTGFWHNMIRQIEPFISTLAALLVARRDLKHDEFIRFRNRLCMYTDEGTKTFDYVKHVLLLKDGFGLPRVTIQNFLALLEGVSSRFHQTLHRDLGDFVSGPIEQDFGTSPHHFNVTYYSLSPLLSVVFQSSDVMNMFPRIIIDDVKVARDWLYRYRTDTWLNRNAIFSNSPTVIALREEIDYDFFNHLCRFMSCQKLDSWPVDHHWQIQYFVLQATECDPRRIRLVEHVLDRFSIICMQRINTIRQKYRNARNNGYDLDSRDKNWKDWNMATDLEIACIAVLIRAIYCREMLLKSFDEYIDRWRILSSQPMLFHSTTMDPELKKYLLRILAANGRWLDQFQQGQVLNAQSMQEQLKVMQDIKSLHDKLGGVRDSHKEVNKDLFLPAQLRQASTNILGGKESTFYKAVGIMQQLTDPSKKSLISQAVHDIEGLLSKEVEESNSVQICYQLHRYLASLHDSLSNKPLATQHRAIAEDLEAMLEPGVMAQIKRMNNFDKLFYRNERRSRGEPLNEAQMLERQLIRLKAELAEAETRNDYDILKVLQCVDAIGDTLRDLGRLPEAVNYYSRFIDGRKRLLPATDRKTLLSTFARSKLLGQLNRFDESIPELRMLQKAFATTGEWKVHSNVTGTLGFQLFSQATSSIVSCSAETRARILAEATEILEKNCETLEELFEPGDKNISIRMSNLAVLYVHQQKYDKAETIYRSAIKGHRTRTSNEADESLIWTQNSLASCYEKMRNYRDAEEIFESILETCIENYEVWHRTTLIIMSNLYDFYLKASNQPKANAFIKEYTFRFHKSVQDLASANREDHFDFLRPKYEFGCKLAICDSYENAVTLLNEVLTAWLAHDKLDGEILNALKMLRYCYASQDPRQLEEEFETNEKLIKYTKSLKGPEHADTLDATAMQVICLHKMGRSTEAIELQLPIIEVRRRTLGDDHEFTINNISYLAEIYTDLKDWEAALRTRKEAFELRNAIDPRSLAALAQASRLAICYENLQQWDRVVEVRRDEYHKRRDVQGAGDRNTLIALTSLAVGLAMVGKLPEAKDAIDQAIDGRIKTLGAAHEETLTARRIKAWIYRDLGHFDEAENILRDVLAVRAEHLMNDLSKATALVGLGRTYKVKGQIDRAKEMFEEAADAAEELRDCGLGSQLDDFFANLAVDKAALN